MINFLFQIVSAWALTMLCLIIVPLIDNHDGDDEGKDSVKYILDEWRRGHVYKNAMSKWRAAH